MNKVRAIWVSGILLWMILPLRGQSKYIFDHLTVNDGLSQNTVNEIYRDSKGFIWVGTNDGLNRYDGYQFHHYHYSYDDTSSISNNRVYEICEDEEENLWVATRGGLNRYDRERDRFDRYTTRSVPGRSLKHNLVRTLCNDHRGNLWIGTLGGGIHVIPAGSDEIRWVDPASGLPSGKVSRDQAVCDIFQDRHGTLWVATHLHGISRFDPVSNEYTFYPLQKKNDRAMHLSLGKTIFEDSDGLLWICTEGDGLYTLDPVSGRIRHFHAYGKGGLLRSEIVKDILEFNDRIWIATDGGGLHVYDKSEDAFRYLNMNPEEPGSLSSEAIYSLFMDNQEILWVGTFTGGLNIYDRNLRKFEMHSWEPGNPNSLSHPTVLCFAEQDNGTIWIGTDGGGMNSFDPESKQFTHICSSKGSTGCLTGRAVTSIHPEGDLLYVGTYNGGMNLYEPGRGVIGSYRNVPGDPRSLVNNNVWAIQKDTGGFFWIGTSEGIQRFDPVTEQFRLISSPSLSDVRYQDRVTNIYRDREGTLWFGGARLYRLNQDRDSLVPVELDPHIQSRIRNMDIRSVYQDSKNRYWICTEGAGLVYFNPSTDSSRIYSSVDGLPNNSVHRILEDDRGDLWISTNYGLSCFDPATGKFRNYDLYDGLQSNQFSYAAALRARNGRFYFGGVNGFNVFHPDSIATNEFIPPVVLTELLIFNRPVEIGGSNSPLQKHISETDQITLKHSQSVITFRFASLNYTSPERNSYQIMMEGFEDEWRDIGTQRSATFTNLDAGRYTFRVRGSNNDLVWNETGTSLQIRVLPPWWRSWYAYVVYGFIILVILSIYRKVFLYQARLKHDIQIKDLEKQQIEELNRMELSFFTNISHEFKTPLTLIQGPLEQIVSSGSFGPRIDKQLEMMRTNVRRLLRLINQLMEFRRVKQSTMDLKVTKGDIVTHLKQLKSVFDDLAESREIHYDFITSADSQLAWFDPDKIEKIVFNLLANAFKYTSAGGTIVLELSIDRTGKQVERIKGAQEAVFPDGCFLISVKDSGAGIPPDKLPHIFERFYQAENEERYQPTSDRGTGIGLSLTKSLVEKHHGIIRAESTPGKGSMFILAIPLTKDMYADSEIREEGQVSRPSISLRPDEELFVKKEEERSPEKIKKKQLPGGKTPSVLIVEDHREVIDFLRETLEHEFTVYSAEDGSQGLKQILEHQPDIVVTDVMMPVMDGFQLCTRIKTDEITSHIPVIMLTAKDEEEDKIRGLKEGADDYIMKPFNPEELVQKIRNILHARSRMWERFRRQISIEPSDITVTSFDEKLLSNALKIVEEHMDDPEFDVSMLVKHVGMSRSVLYRKLKALTGQSAKEFINTIRLKRAAQLLLKNKLSISEITYMVGYNDPQYFSKCFKKQFGKTPSQYAETSRQLDEA
ncbi:MAG: two-component regulator propeller domain-containing protein [Bacteroidales bacterium]